MKGLRNTIVLLFLGLLSYLPKSIAQLPVCTDSGGMLYYDNGSGIYNFDPARPVSATNPVPNTIPFTGLGLAVSPNINATKPPVTFYTTINGYYQYYDGSNWINTGHKASVVNIGAGGGYIYGIVPGGVYATKVYKYDGTGDDALLLTIPGLTSCLFDIIADCDGNFYVLNTGTDQWMRKYNPEGVLLNQWYLSGVYHNAGGGGFGIIDNTVFFDDLNGAVYKGTVDGDTLRFTIGSRLGANTIKDFGNCPKPLFSSTKDTIFYCDNNTTIAAHGIAPYSYTIVYGNPTIQGSGPDFIVSSQDVSMVVLQSKASSCGSGKVTDTFVIIPPPVVNAGPDDTLEGCGIYRDTLQGILMNSTSWVNYDIQWMPNANIISNGNTLKPVISPDANTDYILSIHTSPGQGDCIIRDTVNIAVKDRSVSTGFSVSVDYGCSSDTVMLFPVASGVSYLWDLGDGTYDTAANPMHVYAVQDTYTVTLNVTNGVCTDSSWKSINTLHPLVAAFGPDQDTICINGIVNFTNNSIVTNQDSTSFFWNFGDGTDTTTRNATHRYKHPGVYTVKMTVTDFISCTDTSYGTIIVDSVFNPNFLTDKDHICTGGKIRFTPQTDRTLVSLQWTFGDGSNYVSLPGKGSVQHAYDANGTMPVTMHAYFRACPDTAFVDTVYIDALPQVDLGPDTLLCLNGAPVLLSNRQTLPTGGYHYLWNTGDTAQSLKIVHPGIYRLTISNQRSDCSNTASVKITKDCYMDIPNAFTPNGNGVNDYFFPRQLLSGKITQFKMQIFNRWGELIFETSKINGRGWDGKFNGKLQPEGVYIYLIDAEMDNARTEHYQGNVTLIR